MTHKREKETHTHTDKQLQAIMTVMLAPLSCCSCIGSLAMSLLLCNWTLIDDDDRGENFFGLFSNSAALFCSSPLFTQWL